MLTKVKKAKKSRHEGGWAVPVLNDGFAVENVDDAP